MSNSSTEIIVTADAAMRLGVSTRQIARMVANGTLKPVFKANGIRGAYMFNRTEVDALAKEAAK